jgi:hypothetical protein
MVPTIRSGARKESMPRMMALTLLLIVFLLVTVLTSLSPSR